MKQASAWIMLVAAVALTACGPRESGGQVRIFAEQYYRLIQGGDFEGAAAMYPEGERAFARGVLEEAHEKHGALKSFHFTASEQNTVFSGRFYIFSVGTEYEDGEHDERLTLKSQVNSGDLVMVSQKIDPID
jgi:hypothetical protein